VSAFAALADMLKPKSFAGLFGAAPSIALASLGLTISKKGSPYAAFEARSMIAGAAAFFVYARCATWMMMRRNVGAPKTSIGLLIVWLSIALALWCAVFR
jgi:hypothetical protein